MSLKDKVTKDGGSDIAIDIATEIDENHDLSALANSEGGKKLIAACLQLAVGALQKMRAGRATLTLAEYQAYVADIDANLGLVKRLSIADEYEAQLEEQLAEALSQ